MAVIGTFGSYTAARLGIYASQASLSATGNNIANINTPGYTRQRMDLVSLYSYGSARYVNKFNLNVGYGVLTNGVSQLRDPFLDIRYREENASVGAYDEKLDCLQQLAAVLDEVGRGTDDFGMVEAQFNEFYQQLQKLLLNTGDVVNDTTVRGAAQTLTNLLNSYSNAMDTLATNKLSELKENVKTVNSLLTQIRDLNVQIRDAGIIGDNALELRDARNLCIDQLSAYMKINVTYDMEKIDEFNSVERLNITIAGSDIKLIQGVYGAQLSMPETTLATNPKFDPNDPKSGKYAAIDKNGKWTPTNLMKNPDWDPDYDIEEGEEGYDEKKASKYIYYDPKTRTDKYLLDDEAAKDKLKELDPKLDTDDPDFDLNTYIASELTNAVEGSRNNLLTMFVEPMVDAKGRYARNANHQELKETIELGDNQLYGALQSLREFLTEKGEFGSQYEYDRDPAAAQKRGLPYYQNALDALARKFAEEFNKANQLDFEDVKDAYELVDPDDDTSAFADKAGNAIMGYDANGDLKEELNADYFNKLADKQKELEELKKKAAKGELDPGDEAAGVKSDAERMKELEEEIARGYKNLELLRNEGTLTDLWSFYNGGVLFSNNGNGNDTTNITAGNITISDAWTTGGVRILNTKVADGRDHSTANDNILHMVSMMSQDMDYYPSGIVDNARTGNTKYFTGSFQERLADMSSILGVETQTTRLLYNGYTTTALSLENSRQSVAGVDLNDEATNMMVYQKAYAAACQLMTTLDSMLDKLINGTIR